LKTRIAHADNHTKFITLAHSQDTALRDELIADNLGLAYHLARRFSHRGEAPEDLNQVASVALVKAVDRFDPDRGFEFSTYATRTILGELKRHFRDKGWSVRPPRDVQELYLHLGHAVDSLTQEHSRAPTVAEIANKLNASQEQVLEAMEAGQGYRTTSLEAPVYQETTLADTLGTDDPAIGLTDNRQVLNDAIAKLPPQRRQVLKMRFVDDLTQSEIARRIGVSQMHVSRLITTSLSQLRESFDIVE
jgi:RNA polymerase sigma-B factor